jgi:dihydropteroate synthase
LEAKDTLFYPKKTLNLGGKLIDLSTPLVMGILNLTPDSFYDGGSYLNEKQALKRAEQMILEGASIIDLGAYSTRPGAEDISVEEEIKRLIPILKKIRTEFPNVPISIDTFRSEVALRSSEIGIELINDISGGSMDDTMFETVAKLKVPYILMHIKGKPVNMQKNPVYKDILAEMMLYFTKKINQLNLLGVQDIILDPGFGFGKTLEHNYKLMHKLEIFKILNLPLMVGVSRKSMIYKLLESTPEESLNGTSILNTLALQKGASLLRVHDVKQAVEAIKINNYLNQVSKS